jgi:hypothetical protein
MFASPLYHQKTSLQKVAPTYLKCVTRRSLAVALFIALALVASFANKPWATRKLSVSNLSSSQSRGYEPYLTLNPHQLFGNIVGSIKDAFDDPALVEYAKEQGVDIPDTPAISHPVESDKYVAKELGNKIAPTR